MSAKIAILYPSSYEMLARLTTSEVVLITMLSIDTLT